LGVGAAWGTAKAPVNPSDPGSVFGAWAPGPRALTGNNQKNGGTRPKGTLVAPSKKKNRERGTSPAGRGKMPIPKKNPRQGGEGWGFGALLGVFKLLFVGVLALRKVLPNPLASQSRGCFHFLRWGPGLARVCFRWDLGARGPCFWLFASCCFHWIPGGEKAGLAQMGRNKTGHGFCPVFAPGIVGPLFPSRVGREDGPPTFSGFGKQS